MADEEKKDEGAQKSGNPMMMVLIILIVLLLGAVGALGYFLYTKGIFSDQPQNPQVAAQKEEKKAKEEEENAQKFLANIDGLVLNVTDAKGRPHLMKLSFAVQSIEPTIAQLVESNKDQIIDTVIRQVSARSSEELLTVGGKNMLKQEMIEEINNILNDTITEDSEVKKDSVKNIFFTSFVLK